MELCYRLPCDPAQLVGDPLSICEEYEYEEVPHWRLISTLLRQRWPRDTHALCDVITSFQHDAEVDALLRVLQTSDQESFFGRTLPAVLTAALNMPQLFPAGHLRVLEAGREDAVSVTREQAACLLAHMFLCTLKKPAWSRCWASFSIWYSSASPPVTAYLHTLLVYFSQLDPTGRPVDPKGLVTFHRRVLECPPDWQSSPCQLAQITPSDELEPKAAVEVDFANKDIGFGVSGSQEEVKLAMSPEACIVVLLAPALRDNEALVISGARRVGSHSGIGRHVTFTGPCTDHFEWASRYIIAVDALELDGGSSSSRIDELQVHCLTRELNKAYCGFAPLNSGPFSSIATGHWGCGAFGGHMYAKALIQVMAAAQAGTKIIFHDIQGANKDESFVCCIVSFLALLIECKVTVGKLCSAMLSTGEYVSPNECQGPDLLKLLSEALMVATN